MLVKGSSHSVCLELGVRWGESDAAGIVYYAAMLDWFTEGRIHFLREKGLDYMGNFHENGIVTVVLDVHCRYHHALRPGEKIAVDTCLAEATPAKMTFAYRIIQLKGGILAAQGETVHAYVDRCGRAFNLKKRFPEIWAKLEKITSGDPW